MRARSGRRLRQWEGLRLRLQQLELLVLRCDVFLLLLLLHLLLSLHLHESSRLFLRRTSLGHRRQQLVELLSGLRMMQTAGHERGCAARDAANRLRRGGRRGRSGGHRKLGREKNATSSCAEESEGGGGVSVVTAESPASRFAARCLMDPVGDRDTAREGDADEDAL